MENGPVVESLVTTFLHEELKPGQPGASLLLKDYFIDQDTGKDSCSPTQMLEDIFRIPTKSEIPGELSDFKARTFPGLLEGRKKLLDDKRLRKEKEIPF